MRNLQMLRKKDPRPRQAPKMADHNQWLLSRGFSATPTVKELLKAERSSRELATPEPIPDTPRRKEPSAIDPGTVQSEVVGSCSSSDHGFTTPPRGIRIPPLTARAHQARKNADEQRARTESRALSPDVQWRGAAPFKLNDMDAATAGVKPLPDTYDAVKRTQQLERAATVALENAHHALGQCQPYRLRLRPPVCCPEDGFGPRGCMHRLVYNALLAAKAVAADRRYRKRAFLAEAREVDHELEASLQTWIQEADKSVEALHTVLGSIMHTVHGDERNLAGLPRP